MDSIIMVADQQVKLYNLCEFPKDQKWELKYRASRDGFKATYLGVLLKSNGLLLDALFVIPKLTFLV